jgi:hypothetical protein
MRSRLHTVVGRLCLTAVAIAAPLNARAHAATDGYAVVLIRLWAYRRSVMNACATGSNALYLARSFVMVRTSVAA